jgi:hypothetical protein
VPNSYGFAGGKLMTLKEYDKLSPLERNLIGPWHRLSAMQEIAELVAAASDLKKQAKKLGLK